MEAGKTVKKLSRIFALSLRNAILLLICAFLLFVTYRGNQPMQVSAAPAGMSYFQFIAERIQAAKTVEPARCGWGMLLSLAVLGPIYSVVYTAVAVNPAGFLARGANPDAAIPRGAAGASWHEIPGVWWNTVERLSWTMLGRAPARGCYLGPVAGTGE